MQALRKSPLWGRLTLAWLLLTLAAAFASPLAHPSTLLLVCSGAADGGVHAVLVDQDGSQSPADQHSLDCPLCLPVAPPSAPAILAPERQQALGPVQHSFVAAHIAALVGAPLPSRGPPLL